MNVTRGIVICGMAGLLIWGGLGCGKGSSPSGSTKLKVKPGITFPALMQALNSDDVETRLAAAKELKNIPPADQMRVIPTIKQTLAKETDARVKTALQDALKALGGGRKGGGRR